MRLIGSSAYGVRMPIISPKDPLIELVVDNVLKASKHHHIPLEDGDIIGVTEAVLAKSQGNLATFEDIANDVKRLYADDVVGVVFPIMSRNRFFGILKSIAMGAKEVKVLLSWPTDEVGNPIMDLDDVAALEKNLTTMVTGEAFQKLNHHYLHPFTDIDYISLYESAGENVSVYVSNHPEDILSLTDSILVAEVHNRFRTKNRFIEAGAKKVYTLADILSGPTAREECGFHEEYGVIGSNLSTDGVVKLFPKDADIFVHGLHEAFQKATGKDIEVLIYGDGAYKDPVYGIWELADPVISPAYTKRLNDHPEELKLKYVADQIDPRLSYEEKKRIIEDMIANKTYDANQKQGTTPRKYADLVGSLCDLVGGSGDKGTPVIWIKGYFDNYATP